MQCFQKFQMQFQICCPLSFTTILTCTQPKVFRTTRSFFLWVRTFPVDLLLLIPRGVYNSEKHPNGGDNLSHTGPPSGTRLHTTGLTDSMCSCTIQNIILHVKHIFSNRNNSLIFPRLILLHATELTVERDRSQQWQVEGFSWSLQPTHTWVSGCQC